jgi:hypothetical protein
LENRSISVRLNSWDIFCGSGSGTPLPAKAIFDERVAFVPEISTVAPSPATTKGEPDEQDGHSPRQ